MAFSVRRVSAIQYALYAECINNAGDHVTVIASGDVLLEKFCQMINTYCCCL